MKKFLVLMLIVVAFGVDSLMADSCSSVKETSACSVKDASKDIVATAISAGKFNTLVAAVKAADMLNRIECL